MSSSGKNTSLPVSTHQEPPVSMGEQMSPECNRQIMALAGKIGQVLGANPHAVVEAPQQTGRDIAEGSAAALPGMARCVMDQVKSSLSK